MYVYILIFGSFIYIIGSSSFGAFVFKAGQIDTYQMCWHKGCLHLPHHNFWRFISLVGFIPFLYFLHCFVQSKSDILIRCGLNYVLSKSEPNELLYIHCSLHQALTTKTKQQGVLLKSAGFANRGKYEKASIDNGLCLLTTELCPFSNESSLVFLLMFNYLK